MWHYMHMCFWGVHFLISKSADKALNIAEALSNNTFMYRGLPDSIVSDRDNEFCLEL